MIEKLDAKAPMDYEYSIPWMTSVLLSDGVFVINNYLSGDMLQGLHDEVLDKCKTEAGHYEFGRNYTGPSLAEFDEDSYISKVYNESWMKNLHGQYSANPHLYGKNVFDTHDYKFDGELARNGWLHFDRGWRLKFFIYLTDIDESSGAFSCSPKSRSTGEHLRAEAWRAGNYEHVKNRIELDYPELVDTFPPVPIEAKAGSMVVFDTNTFHKGGKTEEGKERLVVRLHCG